MSEPRWSSITDDDLTANDVAVLDRLQAAALDLGGAMAAERYVHEDDHLLGLRAAVDLGGRWIGVVLMPGGDLVIADLDDDAPERCGICGKAIANQPTVQDTECGTCCAEHYGDQPEAA